MTKKLAVATLLGALAATALPLIVTPVAQAEICGEAGRYVRVGGCIDPIGDVAGAAVAGAAVAGAVGLDRWGFAQPYAINEFPAFPGEAPCISPNGLPYYTPGAEPCYPV
ncbi:MAG: hypothetical protein ACOYBX_06815 [Mycobacterium sp.]